MGLLDDAIREHLELKRRRGSDPAEITRQEQEALGPARRTAEPEVADTPERDLHAADDPVARSEPPRVAPEPDPADDFFVDDPDDPFLPDSGDSAEAESLGGSTASNPRHDVPPPLSSSRDGVPPPPPSAPAAEDPWDDETAAIVDGPPPAAAPRRSAAQRLAELDEAEARRAAAPPPAPEPPPAAPAPVGDADPFDAGPPTREFTRDDVHDAAGHDAADDIVPADEEHDGEDLLEETPDFLEETPEHDRLWFEQRPPRDFDFDG